MITNVVWNSGIYTKEEIAKAIPEICVTGCFLFIRLLRVVENDFGIPVVIRFNDLYAWNHWPNVGHYRQRAH